MEIHAFYHLINLNVYKKLMITVMIIKEHVEFLGGLKMILMIIVNSLTV